MSDISEILGESPVAPVVAPEAAPQEPIEASEVVDQPEAEAPVEAVEQPSSEAVPEEPKMVPLAALQETRAEMKALKQQIAEANQPKQSAPQQQPSAPPDLFDEPEKVMPYISDMVRKQTETVRLDMSETYARNHHGNEAVDAAFEALRANYDPAQHQRIMSDKDPFGALVSWHKQQQTLTEIGPDPEAWKASERDKIRQELEAEIAAKQITEKAKPASPPPSLASQTNLGSRSTGPQWSGPTPLGNIIAE